jgi:hypothetical protein
MERMRAAPLPTVRLVRLWAVFGFLLLGGCLESEQRLVVREDGSGTLRLASRLDLARAKAALAIARERAGTESEPGEGEDDFADLDPDNVRKVYEGIEGVRLAETSLDRGEEILEQRLTFTFTSLGALALSGALGDMDVVLEPRQDGAWRLRRRLAANRYARAYGPPPSEARAAAQERVREASLAPFAEPLKRLSLTYVIALPGRVLEVNGAAVAPDAQLNPVTWSIRFDDLKKSERLEQEIVFRVPEATKLEEFTVLLGDIERERERREAERRKAEAEDAGR